MSTLSSVDPRIDPAASTTAQKEAEVKDQTKSAMQNAQEQAAAAADAIKTNAGAAYNKVANSQAVQDLANGPAAQNVRKQADLTSNEFSSLASARRMPSYTAANGNQLTHYHSFFTNLLSWRNPRATGITFVSTILSIFACRYLPIVPLALKGLAYVLFAVTVAESVAKLAMGSSVASSIRPRRYYKIPKENLEATLDDVEQLINFFVIETQRIIFAENVVITGAAFATVFISFWLAKLLPAWGFALFATSVLFLAPLIYVTNQEFIDEHITHAGKVVSEQTQQLRDVAYEQSSRGLETVKQYTGDYTAAATEYIGQSRQKIPPMSEVQDAVMQKVGQAQAAVVGATQQASDAVQNTAQQASASAQSTAQQASATVQDKAQDAKREADAQGLTNGTSSTKFDSTNFPAAPNTAFASSAEHTKPIVHTEDGNIAASAQ